jgi:biotin transport system substrate-specific component
MNSTPRSALGVASRAEPSRVARQVAGVLVFATLTAVAARISLPLPGTPIPFTFQPMMVLLAGLMLGARLGAASQLAYLMAGVAGLPVFVAGGGAAYLLGPTGGYLMAYPLAAFVVGALAGERALRHALALCAGLVVIYAGGVSWLALHLPVDRALALGLIPFLLADLVKAALAMVVALRFRRGSLSLFGG